MKTRFKHLMMATALVGVLGTTATAWALGGHRDECTGMRDGPRAERMQERMNQRMNERQERLKSALALTPAQAPAWETFQTAMQTHAAAANTGPNRDDWASLSTPQRMEQMQARQRERLNTMEQRLQAVKAFYAVLSPAQQKVFDSQYGRKAFHGGLGDGHHPHPRG